MAKNSLLTHTVFNSITQILYVRKGIIKECMKAHSFTWNENNCLLAVEFAG